MLGEYTNKKMAATSPCQLQNNTMIETRCYPSSVLCIRLWFAIITSLQLMANFPSLMEITAVGGVNKYACFTIICTSVDGDKIRTPIRTCQCTIHFVRLQPLNLPFGN